MCACMVVSGAHGTDGMCPGRRRIWCNPELPCNRAIRDESQRMWIERINQSLGSFYKITMPLIKYLRQHPSSNPACPCSSPSTASARSQRPPPGWSASSSSQAWSSASLRATAPASTSRRCRGWPSSRPPGSARASQLLRRVVGRVAAQEGGTHGLPRREARRRAVPLLAARRARLRLGVAALCASTDCV
jgi:hypothetical protein